MTAKYMTFKHGRSRVRVPLAPAACSVSLQELSTPLRREILFSPFVVFRGHKRYWHPRGMPAVFWLPASHANFLGSQTPITPTLPVGVALRLGPNSQLGPTMSLRFPTTGLSQLGNKNTVSQPTGDTSVHGVWGRVGRRWRGIVQFRWI